jgi:hypothetical protein
MVDDFKCDHNYLDVQLESIINEKKCIFVNYDPWSWSRDEQIEIRFKNKSFNLQFNFIFTHSRQTGLISWFLVNKQTSSVKYYAARNVIKHKMLC